MEILSLKFSQKDIYASSNCAEYGVVVGRVSANSGFGVPNAKVSIFIPQSDEDTDDPVISALYPYKEINDVSEAGYKYNLLPERQQHRGHAATGTFPGQQDILTREEVLEVFENYYKYTVKTNSSGDFMIWGVPIGIQTLHIDIDLSDIGCFSLRPYDFIKKGAGVDDFERFYKFKSSNDIAGLPQIVTFDRSVEVYPLWGDEELCEIGITRTDFDLLDKGIKIEPISLILASAVTDDDSDAVKRNGKIRRNTGYKCNLQTSTGKIECIRQTGNTVLGSDGTTRYPELETFNISEVIDEDGVAMAVLPMNLDYVYTNVFGEEEITNDPNKGIPTTAVARFKFSLDFNNPKKSVANYLVPNIREFNVDNNGQNKKREYSEAMLSSYVFSDNFEDYLTVISPEDITLDTSGYNQTVKDHKKDLILGTNNDNIPEDYFYKFIYGKVYTVSSFQGTHYESGRRDAFLGLKQIRPNTDDDCSSSTSYIPTNFGFKNRTKFSILISQILLFLQYIFAIIILKFAEILGRFLWSIGRGLWNIRIPLAGRIFGKLGQKFMAMAYSTQDKFTKILPLTIYPDCEECTGDDEAYVTDSSFADQYCRVGELQMEVVSTVVWGILPTKVRLQTLNSASTSYYLSGITQTSILSQVDDETNGIFPGEFAKDPSEFCSGTTSPTYAELDTLDNQTIPLGPPSPRDERFVAEMFSYRSDYNDEFSITGGTQSFAESLLWFSNGGETGDITLTDNGTHTYVDIPISKWIEYTGLDLVNLIEAQAWLTANPGKFYAVLRIYDRSQEKFEEPFSGNTIDIETGCEKYDKLYNEDITPAYIWSSGTTYGIYTLPFDPQGSAGSIESQTSYDLTAMGYREYPKNVTLPDEPYGNLLSSVIAGTDTKRLPYKIDMPKIGVQTYDRKSKSGFSEFRDGVFTIIPVIGGKSHNTSALHEWYRRKRIGLTFCGGVVNYSFIDNWLHGLLYFFKFDKRVRWDNEEIFDLNQRGTKYPREMIFYNVLDKEFYYRSTPYYNEEFIGQNFLPDRELLHPTTFYDIGVRDEFLSDICTDTRVDPYCSVVRDITNTSYQDPANVVEYAINYRLDINDGKFNVDDFFSGSNLGSRIKVFDGDITQLMSINCEAGIEEFDLDTPHYFMFNGELMDPEDDRWSTYFKDGSLFGPVPIDFKFDINGAFIRSCLNNRLGDYSQKVPFYLWDKKGTGFGDYGSGVSDDQFWDKSKIGNMKLQRLYSLENTTGTTTNYVMANGEEEYLLRPMTIDHNIFWYHGDYEDSMERFDTISYLAPADQQPNGAQLNGYIEGELWLQVVSGSIKDPRAGNIWVVVNSTWIQQDGGYYQGHEEIFIPQTVQNYTGNKQVLSTPFLFYFGLRPEKSALDILIKYFGPKGAFGTNEQTTCPSYNATPLPSATPAATYVPPPSPGTSNPWASPTPTPTPTPSYGSNYVSAVPNSIVKTSSGGNSSVLVSSGGVWNAHVYFDPHDIVSSVTPSGVDQSLCTISVKPNIIYRSQTATIAILNGSAVTYVYICQDGFDDGWRTPEICPR